jgi:hypothetical protein
MGIPWNPYQPTNVTQIARSEPRGLLNDSLGYAQQHPNEEGAEQCAVRSAEQSRSREKSRKRWLSAFEMEETKNFGWNMEEFLVLWFIYI